MADFTSHLFTDVLRAGTVGLSELVCEKQLSAVLYEEAGGSLWEAAVVKYGPLKRNNELKNSYELQGAAVLGVDSQWVLRHE